MTLQIGDRVWDEHITGGGSVATVYSLEPGDIVWVIHDKDVSGPNSAHVTWFKDLCQACEAGPQLERDYLCERCRYPEP